MRRGSSTGDHSAVDKLAALAGRHWRAGTVTLTAILYTTILALFFEPFGYLSLILGVAPVVTAALLYGFSAGMISLALVALANFAVILVAGESPVGWMTDGGVLTGTLCALLSVGLFGWNASLHTRLARERRVLLQTQDVTIFALAYEAELRDQATGRHLERTSTYVRTIAEELARRSSYSEYLTKTYIADLVRAAPLHDIGKVGIPDSILLKPAKLTTVEFSIMKEHCELGAQVLKLADEKLEFQSFLRIAIQLVLSHHEKWDGAGYPAGLGEERIPLSGRIMALADVYDALRSERNYKSAVPHAQSCEIIDAGKGTHFDSQIVDAFLRRHKDLERVSNELGDGGPTLPLEELEPVDNGAFAG